MALQTAWTAAILEGEASEMLRINRQETVPIRAMAPGFHSAEGGRGLLLMTRCALRADYL